MDISIEQLAARQLQDYRGGTPGTYFGEAHDGLSLDEAYAVQIEVARLRVAEGDEIIGYKIGCTGPGILKQFGMRGPIRGCLFRSELRPSGVVLDYSAFTNLAIEGEMAARIGEAGKIASVFPIVELHNFVFRGERKTLPELIANNGLHAGIVLPRDERGSVLDLVGTLTVVINGVPIDEGNLWCMPGGAPGSLEWLDHHLELHGRKLKAGDVVLTGTPLGLHPVKPGDHVRVVAEGGATVECHIGQMSPQSSRRLSNATSRHD